MLGALPDGRPAAPSTVPPRDKNAVLGVPIAVRRTSAPVDAFFIRPMHCADCDGQFFPREVPAGLPLCWQCEG